MSKQLVFTILLCLGLLPGCFDDSTTDQKATTPATVDLGPTPAGSIRLDDSSIKGWAVAYSSYTIPASSATVDAQWQSPAKALGPATGNVSDIVCLGDGGSIVLEFNPPLTNGSGADFAIFENSFSDDFLELAFVEASNDGSTFYRFPCHTQITTAVSSYGTMDAGKLSGFAGLYRAGFGTPFDLADLAATGLDLGNVRYIRIIDVIGDGSTKDSNNNPVYDPYPNYGSPGFDLEAVAALNTNS